MNPNNLRRDVASTICSFINIGERTSKPSNNHSSKSAIKSKITVSFKMPVFVSFVALKCTIEDAIVRVVKPSMCIPMKINLSLLACTPAKINFSDLTYSGSRLQNIIMKNIATLTYQRHHYLCS